MKTPKKSLKTIACTALTLVLASSLAACGAVSKTPSNPTASEAFNGGGVWYSSSFTDLDEVAKDETIDQVFIFQNGEVALYDFDTVSYTSDEVSHMKSDDKRISTEDMSDAAIKLTYGDLNKLSQEDIIKRVKETHEANFEANKKAAIEKCNAEIDRLQPNIKAEEENVSYLETHKDEIIAAAEAEAPSINPIIDYSTGEKAYDPQREYDEELESRQSALAEWKSRLTFYQERLDTLNSLTYQEPKPVQYELAIKTDDSGNNATDEALSFEAELLDLESFLQFGSTDTTTAPYTSKEQKITFRIGGAVQTVYDTKFGGYDELFTIVKEDTNPYKLDSRDSKGVTVD